MKKRMSGIILFWMVQIGVLSAQQSDTLNLPPIPPPPSQFTDPSGFTAIPASANPPIEGVAPLPLVKSPPAAPPSGTFDPISQPEGNLGTPAWLNNSPPVSSNPLLNGTSRPYVVDGYRNSNEIVIAESQFWIGSDFLLLFGKGYKTAPLVGIIHDANNPVIDNIYPDDRLGNGPFSAVRLRGGFSFNTDGITSGFDVSYTHIFDRTITEQFSYVPGQILGRPIIDASNSRPNLLQATTADGFLQGSILIKSHTEMNGGEIRYFISDPVQFGDFFQWLVGFRYFRLSDRLKTDFNTQIPSLQLGLHLHDEFRTTNRAYLSQFGFRVGYSGSSWFLNGELKLGLGVIAQRGSIDGSTTAGQIGASLSPQAGGLLALPSNIGNYEQSRFAFMPELMLNLGYRLTPSLTLVAGYEFSFLNSVIRPNGLIDSTVNTQAVPSVNSNPTIISPIRPSPTFTTESFWLQGITLGIQYRF